MTDEQKVMKDLLVTFYQENATQCQHHETQRSTVTSSIIAIDTIVIGIITFDQAITSTDLPLTVFLIFLGIYGAAFNMKHYERYRFHLERSKKYRSKADELFANNTITELKNAADEIHEKKFPRLSKLRIYYWWSTLHLIVASIGIILTVLEIFY